MSHDQKPGRMRVVGSASAVPQRRRGDAPGSAGTSVAVPSAAGATAKGGTAPASATGGKRVLLLAILFVAGAAIGGAALPLLGLV